MALDWSKDFVSMNSSLSRSRFCKAFIILLISYYLEGSDFCGGCSFSYCFWLLAAASGFLFPFFPFAIFKVFQIEIKFKKIFNNSSACIYDNTKPYRLFIRSK